ncbi:MAG TPA: class I SAM-dependent methyltransferase [Usitatibacteraceae bacterium]
MSVDNSTTRFSSRVDDYVKYRPPYPPEILDLLAAKCALTPESVIADIGSGTGMLAKLFLDNGNAVIGVEPNAEMRAAGEKYLAEYGRFTSMDGSAEATRLPVHAMDFVVAGQAFHWFDRDRTRKEFLRLLKPDGVLALIWNDRRLDSTPFMRDYEALLREYGSDYRDIDHKKFQQREILAPFFGGEFFEASFDNNRSLDLDGLMGRLHSASYMPARDHPDGAQMTARASEIFAAHAVGGKVSFEYDTRIYYGLMA